MVISGYIATIVGTIAGLISLYLVANGWKKKVLAAAGILSVAISAYYISTIVIKVSAYQSTYHQANALVSSRQMDHSSEGFILAALTFLEAKKIQFPDTYQRALEVCEKYECTSPDVDLQNGYNSIEAASILSSILRSIAVMSSP